MENHKIALRPFQDTDIPMFAAWLRQDYVLKWYEDPESWLTEINGRHDKYFWIHHFIVTCGEMPIGFCQYYDCCDAKDLEDWYTVIHRCDMCSIDYLIGNEEYLGKGYGKELVHALTEYIKDNVNVHEIIVQPDEANHASIGVLLANNYVFDQQSKYYRNLLK